MKRATLTASVLAAVVAVLSSTSCGTCNCDPCAGASVLSDDDCPGGATLGAQFSSERFSAGGACWQDEESARACNAQCEAALEACDAHATGNE